MAWCIPESDIEHVSRCTDLRALVRSRGIELKEHGSKTWIGRCPFHPDTASPNFVVSPDQGHFQCMACGKAGNTIQFVEQHDGVSFRHGRFGSQFVYEALFDLDAPDALAHVGLIDVETLRQASPASGHDYKTNLTGFDGRVAGQNGQLAGGGKTSPPPANTSAAGP